jgi:hypothetical protein
MPGEPQGRAKHLIALRCEARRGKGREVLHFANCCSIEPCRAVISDVKDLFPDSGALRKLRSALATFLRHVARLSLGWDGIDSSLFT